MKEEDQRIAIAIACGWKLVDGMWHNPSGTPIGFLPDYLNDLNAMHEAEKVLTMDQCRIFDELLWTNSESCASIEFKWHSPANARAEAFLKTLNLWKD